MRAVLTIVHRWIGLAIATFLIIAGATGAVISWDHELDALLNPGLMQGRSGGSARPALELAALIETRDPRARVTYVPLTTAAGASLAVFVEPRLDPASGRLFQLGYNQVFVDVATGTELGRREWGAVWPITRKTLISFLYKLHYSLHVPALWSEERWGLWLMGSIALVWTLDCFVGFYLTLPRRTRDDPRRKVGAEDASARGWWSRWSAAWRIKTSGSPYRLTFDVHRAFGLWTWALLLTLAFTGFSLNLYREIFYPVISTISRVTPTPLDLRKPAAQTQPIEPKTSPALIVEDAKAEARRLGWPEPAGALSYEPLYGIYQVLFFRPDDDARIGGGAPASLYYDALDARLLGDRRPWTGTAADIFVQAQFPLHSGRILGLPGRIMISAMGVVTATLSITGVIVWWRKRAARGLRRQRARRAG